MHKPEQLMFAHHASSGVIWLLHWRFWFCYSEESLLCPLHWL